MKKQLFIANWKMQLSYIQSYDFIKNNYDILCDMAYKKSVVLCPSFPALYTLYTLCKDSSIYIGAQNVSRHSSGSYTGDVSALSLAEVGCSYCIIGHTESRRYNHETNVDIAHKVKELIKHKIIPIICIAETKDQYDQQETYSVLQEQLTAIFEAVAESAYESTYVIVYEPIWFVDTDNIIDKQTLTKIFSWIDKQCSLNIHTPYFLLYGGTINAHNASFFLDIEYVDGFLLGGLSTDIDTFKSIVLCDTFY